jgi:predicted nucleic-acid-binding Zn-ribbon protein
MYINRNDALEILGKLSREPYYQHDGEDYYVGVAEATGEIYSMPSVEVKEVIHAKWGKPVLINGYWHRTCSHCIYGSAHGAIDNKEFMPMFCPNCGSTMDEK